MSSGEESKFDSFYQLHIPKTAGRFIREEVIYPLVPTMTDAGINFIGRTLEPNPQHIGWVDEISQSTYVMSSFRDPVEQAVSYFCERTTNWGRHVNAPASMAEEMFTKEKMLRQIKKVPYFYENHQSKFFIYNDAWMNGVKRDYSLDPKNYVDLVYSRVRRLNLFLKITSEPFYSIPLAKKVCLDLNLSLPERKFCFNEGFLPRLTNGASKKIYSELTRGEKDTIMEMSSLDAEIYFNDSLFTPLGEYSDT
jgi:hypothetical protein